MQIIEESVFLTISGYTKAENTNGTFTSEKPTNNREIDMIRLECDFEDGNIVNRIRHSFLYSFALAKPTCQKKLRIP